MSSISNFCSLVHSQSSFSKLNTYTLHLLMLNTRICLNINLLTIRSVYLLEKYLLVVFHERETKFTKFSPPTCIGHWWRKSLGQNVPLIPIPSSNSIDRISSCVQRLTRAAISASNVLYRRSVARWQVSDISPSPSRYPHPDTINLH